MAFPTSTSFHQYFPYHTIPYNIAGLTTVLYTFTFILYGVLLSRITPETQPVPT